MSTVTLPRALAEAMLAHAGEAPALEVCGLLGGAPGAPTRLYRIPNVADEPARRYLMAPEAQLEAFREMRARGEALAGIYHSHPDGRPVPSPTDRAEVAYPDADYFIIALGRDPALTAWRYREGAFRALALRWC